MFCARCHEIGRIKNKKITGNAASHLCHFFSFYAKSLILKTDNQLTKEKWKCGIINQQYLFLKGKCGVEV